jgi:phage gp36-like protein
MFLTVEELKTHLYHESINVISGEDDTIPTAAIDAAVSEARGYLAAFDRDRIFESEGSERNALLLLFIKDMAVWHFVNLCNAGTELSLRQDRYDRAVDWLKAVQKGNVSPDLPIVENTDGSNSIGIIKFGSNPKREQHF